MEKIAEQITESFIQKLPEQAQFFTLSELRTSGIPLIVVETLKKNMNSTIEAEMAFPASEWVQTGSEEVKAAWQNLVEVSKQYVKIPAAKLSYQLCEAVEQCLELTVKPRQSVPEVIFRTQEELGVEAVKERISFLQVNRQLGLALLKYMEKKEKPSITVGQARELVRRVDQLLTEDYHPLNWAKILKPLFELAGPEVHSSLLQVFFDDKDMPEVARKFEQIDRQISETEFIELMSIAGLPDMNYDEKGEQQDLIPAEEEVDVTSKEEATGTSDKNEDDDEEAPGAKGFYGEEFEEPEKKDEPPQSEDDRSEGEPEEKDESIVSLFSEVKKRMENDEEVFPVDDDDKAELSLTEAEDETGLEDEDVPLLSKFMFDESVTETEDDTEEVEESSAGEQEYPSLYERINPVQEDRNRLEEEEESESEAKKRDDESEQEEIFGMFSYQVNTEETNPARPVQATDEEGEEPDEENEEEDTPMWRSFLERDDVETESGFEYEKEPDDEIEYNEEFIAQPIYDLAAGESDREKKIVKISKWLKDERSRFVEEIFNNSEIAYERALMEIVDFEDWKSASNYLEREVFSRNQVDVYDETAVDFTDRLHSYFMEYKS